MAHGGPGATDDQRNKKKTDLASIRTNGTNTDIKLNGPPAICSARGRSQLAGHAYEYPDIRFVLRWLQAKL